MPIFRRVTHPDFSDLLVHFTGRSGTYANLPEEIGNLSPTQRLESILQSHTIWPSRPFYASAPVVCFSEVTDAGLRYLLGEQGYWPSGIVFRRDLVYQWGGGPVFHYRPDEWTEHYWQLPAGLRARFVRFQAGQSEWLWEREWRIVFEEGAPGFQFERDDVEALIVESTTWPPPEPDPAYVELLDDDEIGQTAGPPTWLPPSDRWWWNPRLRQLQVLRT